jgi:AcrR family transcriptional regulator
VSLPGSSRQGSKSLPPEAGSTEDGRRARGDVTRARILEAALQLASVQGLEGLTIGQVAAQAGVSKGHLAELLGDREALQCATIDAALDVYHGHVLSRVASGRTAADKLRIACLGWYDYVANRVLPGGCLVTAAYSEFRAMPGLIRDRLIRVRQEHQQFLLGLVHIALSDSRRSDVEPEEVVHRILANEAIANVAFFLGEKRTFERARMSTDQLLRSISEPR